MADLKSISPLQIRITLCSSVSDRKLVDDFTRKILHEGLGVDPSRIDSTYIEELAIRSPMEYHKWLAAQQNSLLIRFLSEAFMKFEKRLDQTGIPRLNKYMQVYFLCDAQVKNQKPLAPCVYDIHSETEIMSFAFNQRGFFDHHHPNLPEKIQDFLSANRPPFEFTQKMAEYSGGEEEMLSHLQSAMGSFSDSRTEPSRTTIHVTFTIRPDGSVSDFEFEGPQAPGLQKFIRMIILSLPKKFVPAQQNGQPVMSRMTLPMRFR